MRQIGTLPDEATAQKIADYLLTLNIETQLDPPGQEGIALWVRDEDKVEQGRSELQTFLQNPGDPRYQKAGLLAQAMRRRESLHQQRYERKQQTFDQEMRAGATEGRKSVTIALLTLSIAVSLGSNFGQNSSAITQFVSIAPYAVQDGMISWNYLQSIRQGEVWRLVTPIFLHLDVMHLVFNMLMLLALGTRVEMARGWWRYLILVLFLAGTSNVAEYYCSISLNRSPSIDFTPSPMFGGMSGVLYGLFGYMWMKSRFQPQLGLFVPTEMVVVMLGWLLLCLLGVVGPVANVAHGVGLLGGILVGYLPTLWQRSGTEDT